MLTLDSDRGDYECKGLNIAGERTQMHNVRVTWEDAITDELGNYIGIRSRNSSASESVLCGILLYLLIVLFSN